MMSTEVLGWSSRVLCELSDHEARPRSSAELCGCDALQGVWRRHNLLMFLVFYWR